jgi:hypothetical protein
MVKQIFELADGLGISNFLGHFEAPFKDNYNSFGFIIGNK